jgi:hypothetical protein
MAELTLLLAAHERLLGAGAAAVLRAWTTRGDRLPDAASGRDASLRASFEFIGTTLPAAALTRSLDAKDAATALWLRADPAWVMADAVTLRLMASGGALQLSDADSAALAGALKPLFGDAGFPLEATTPLRWYLRCPPGAQLPVFSPVDAALGDDVARHLPQGDAGKRWEYLLNEAQVILHHHAVNAERARRGQAPVNSLWIWGGGKLPDWVRTRFTDVRSDDDIVRALGAQAKVAVAPLSQGLADDFDDDLRMLVDLGMSRDVAALERDWLQPLQRALAERKVEAVELHFAGGESYRYRHRHRWRIWRRIAQGGA